MFNHLLRLVAGLALLVFCIGLFKDHESRELWARLTQINPLYWVTLSAISVTVFLVLAAQFKLAVGLLGLRISLTNALCYAAMTNFLNTVLPLKSGLLVRGVYLKKRFSFSWEDYFIALAGAQFVNLGLLSLIMLFSVIAIWPLQQNVRLGFSPFWLLLMAPALIAVGWFISRIRELYGKVIRIVSRALLLWFGSPATLLKLSFWSLVLHGLSYGRLVLALVISGSTLDYGLIVMMYALVTLGLSANFTPGNIGVREAALVVVGVAMGGEASVMLQASVVDRLSSLFVVIVFGGYSTWLLSRQELDGFARAE